MQEHCKADDKKVAQIINKLINTLTPVKDRITAAADLAVTVSFSAAGLISVILSLFLDL
jgi:uncharacterized protein YejL (UPF0352 family)